MKKILIVEDDASTADFIKTFLSYQGFEVRHTHEGSSVMETARNFKPDLILLDVMLPGMDGHSIQVKLLEDEVTRKIPILLVTARMELEQIFSDAENVVGLIAKPFDPRELLKKIKSIS